MSNRPSASLVYGIEIDMPKDYGKFDNIMDKEEHVTSSQFGMCDYEQDVVIICIKNLGCDSFDWFNTLGKTLPVATPEHDEMIKDFCKRNGFKFKKPQWFVLGYYGWNIPIILGGEF